MTMVAKLRTAKMRIEGRQKLQRGFEVGAKVRDIFLMGHEVHGADS